MFLFKDEQCIISLNILLNFRFRSPYLNSRPLSIYLVDQFNPTNLNFGHGLACLNLKLKQLCLNLWLGLAVSAFGHGQPISVVGSLRLLVLLDCRPELA